MRIEQTVEVQRPPEAVFAFVARRHELLKERLEGLG
jgi:carbon monoxide dehydrogenase subunit G